MLLEISYIQEQLDDMFLPIEPLLTGFRLVSSKIRQEDVERLGQQLNVALPEEFKSTLQRFSLDKFTIGPIAFCNTGDYLAWIVKNNCSNASNLCPWWSSGKRPNDLLLIANSDPYAVLVNCRSGIIQAFKHSEQWDTEIIMIAGDFVQFLRGLGTVFLCRSDKGGNSALADDVSRAVGGGSNNEFWRWLAA